MIKTIYLLLLLLAIVLPLIDATGKKAPKIGKHQKKQATHHHHQHHGNLSFERGYSCSNIEYTAAGMGRCDLSIALI